MPNFSVNGFNVGTDFSATLQDNFGDLFPLDSLGLLTEFDSESMDRELEVIPISGGGVPVFQTIWAGVRGRIMYARTNGSLANVVTGLMSAYHDAGIIPQFSMASAVLNRDGSIDEYLHTGLQLSRSRFGNYRSEKEVDQQVEIRAGRMIVTGPNANILANLVGLIG